MKVYACAKKNCGKNCGKDIMGFQANIVLLDQ